MSRNNASGRFFVSPTVIEKWRVWHPHHSDEEALATILDYADAAKQQPDTAGGLMRFRAGRPWRGFLLVAAPERGKTLPVVVDLAPPFDGWKPPGPHGGKRPGVGRPVAEVARDVYRKSLPLTQIAWLDSQDGLYLERLIQADMDAKKLMLG